MNRKKSAQEFGVSSVPRLYDPRRVGNSVTYYPGAATKEALTAFIEDAFANPDMAGKAHDGARTA